MRPRPQSYGQGINQMAMTERELLSKLVAATSKALELPQPTPTPPAETAEAAEAEALRLNALRNPPRGR